MGNVKLTPSSLQLPELVEPHLQQVQLPQPLGSSSNLQDRHRVAVWLRKQNYRVSDDNLKTRENLPNSEWPPLTQ